MWHLELPEMKAEIVVVILFTFGPGTRKSLKRAPKEPPRPGPPESRKSASWSLKRVRKESESQVFWLFSDSFETPGRTLSRLWESRPGGLNSGPQGPGRPQSSHFSSSVPLLTIQSETWLVHAKVREPHLNPPVRMSFPGFPLLKRGREAESQYEPGGSDVVRELSREPAIFQIGFKHQRFPQRSWRSFRRNGKEIFELLLLGKIVRSIFHQNSTANFTIKLHYEVLGCGGPYGL